MHYWVELVLYGFAYHADTPGDGRLLADRYHQFLTWATKQAPHKQNYAYSTNTERKVVRYRG